MKRDLRLLSNLLSDRYEIAEDASIGIFTINRIMFSQEPSFIVAPRMLMSPCEIPCQPSTHDRRN